MDAFDKFLAGIALVLIVLCVGVWLALSCVGAAIRDSIARGLRL